MRTVRQIFLAAVFITGALFAQKENYVDKFELHKSDIALERNALPYQYFDKIGTKAALMGFESGGFEMWIWPWKVLRDFDLEFFLGTSTRPILSKDIVRTINVTPEATTLTFVYETFVVKEIIFVPHNESAAVILLDVNTSAPLTIVPQFFPVMQPQWPAGVGGQYSYWDSESKAFVISEAKQRGLFLCGSPAAEEMSAPPAHMFADNPLQFKFTIKPGETAGKYIPIVIAGGNRVKMDTVRDLYTKINKNIRGYYEGNVKYYNDLLSSTVTVSTPNAELNLALEWGKIALNNLTVDNPVLGKGLVAGYGLSGGGTRPGFAWYFGGDAYINSFALTALGDYKTVRDALEFTQKWQRQEDFPIRKKSSDEKNNDIGKMAHELSQSEGLIDWWNDYHFGYNHADTSPWYIIALGDYFRATGDTAFVKKSWESVKLAYNWCKTKDSNNDGLMDLKGAGLGVLEFGKLVKIHNDMYTQAIWTQALKEMIEIAAIFGDNETQNDAQVLYAKASENLEKIYWMEEEGYYSYGAGEDGTQVKVKSPYSTIAQMFELLDKKRSVSSMKKMIEPDLVTDWGVRSLSNTSELYEPLNYNYGAVWPFTSMFFAAAQYNYNFNLAGYANILSVYPHIFKYGLGVMPEVFSGNINTKLGEAYHDQGFSVTGFVYPIIRGMLGLKTNIPEGKIVFSPKLPADWDSISVSNIPYGGGFINFSLVKSSKGIRLHARNNSFKLVSVEFAPSVGFGTKLDSAIYNNSPVDFALVKEEQSWLARGEFDLRGDSESELILYYDPVPEAYLIPDNNEIGSVSSSIRITAQEYSDKKLTLTLEGKPGALCRIGITCADKITEISGAELINNILIAKFDNDSKSNEKRIILNLK